ncbi:MAG: PAS domain S-box protein [Candidatus Velthaea sp.]
MIDVDPADVAAVLLEQLPHLIWAADADGELTYVNERWGEYTGLPDGMLLGCGWTAALEPASRAAFLADWKAEIEAGVTLSEHRLHYRRFDGVYGWFLWRAVPVAGDDETGARWIGTLTDIDAHVRIEERLRANDERNRSILDTTQEGVWIVDAEGRTRYANRRFAEMLGYARPEELLGVSAFDFFRAADHAMVREQLARRREGEVASKEYRFARRDGSDLWTITAASPIFNRNGAFVGSIGMVTDITERKSMEVRLATAAAEYQSLAEATPQIVWTAEPDGSFDYVNGRWTEYTGIAREHARGRGWMAAVQPSDRAGLQQAWQAALDGSSEIEVALRLRRAADDGCRWHVMRARPLFGTDGSVARWFGTLTDIHNERRTARQLEIIARTSTVLAESFDSDALLSRLAQLICNEFAQFVLILLINDKRRLYTVATAHRSPEAASAMRSLHGRPLLLPEFEGAVIARMSDGEPYSGETDAAQLASMVPAENAAAIERAGHGTFLNAPLQARGRTLGAIVAYAPPDAPFTADETNILADIAARAAIAVENAELYAREHRVSVTLQQALLPSRLPDIPGLRFDAIYSPATTEAQIGGDWYDAVELSDGRIVVSIGDVTGRGVRAAVIMGRVRQAIEALATYQSDPAQLLNAADTVLRRTHADAIVTALVGVIDLNRRTFAYATAGHPTPIIRSADGRLVTLPGSGLPLGLRDAHQPPTSTIVLPANSLLLMYTDGLVESTRDIEEGERRVALALLGDRIVTSAHPAAELKAAVLHDGSSDDVAIFTVSIGDLSGTANAGRTDSPLRSAWSMHWSFDARDARSTRDVRELFLAYLRAKGKQDADYAGAELVFGELIGNVVRHAPGTVDIEVEWRGDAPVLHILDRGPGYDRSAALPPSLSETGRGLYLVSTLTREFTVTRLPGYGSHARAVLPIDRTAP